MDGDPVGFKGDSAIIVMQVKITEISSHNVGLETQAQHKTAKAMTRIKLHDMP
jgi:hypothetical protein